MTPGALLLLLAVAASQLDFMSAVVFSTSGELELTSCDISYYGKTYTWMDVTLHPDSSVHMCFKNRQGEASAACIYLSIRLFADRVSVTQNNVETNISSELHAALPNFLTSSSCYVDILFYHATNINIFRFQIYDFGQQAALSMQALLDTNMLTFFVQADVSDSVMASWTFTDAELTGVRYFDISACRFLDRILEPGSTISYPENCTETLCDQTASLTPSVTLCEPWEECDGNNVCVPQTLVCTVSSSSVIDFLNQLHSVQDRCVYTLVSPSGMSDFGVLAGFRERRLQDMPFLDYLILLTAGSTIYLEQGGRVEVDGLILTLSSTPVLVSGVWLSMNDTGITAVLPFFNLVLRFDGNTAHLIGPVGESEGLCGSSIRGYTDTTRLLNASLSTLHSAEGCEVQYTDSFNDMSHCNQSTQRCNSMWQAPFTACHHLIDPSPYISTCIDTSCNYPDVDGVTCQFLEAYAKSCYHLGGIRVESWRTMAGCSIVLQDACLNQRCSDHEFCGEKLGEVRCLCRALFAAEYEPDGLGEPTDCTTQNSVSITLAVCLLWEKGIDYSVLHLNDPNCVGYLDEENHLVTFSFNDSNTCRMEVVTMGNKLIYKNTIRTMNRNTTMDITYYDHVEIDFSCAYTDITRNRIHSVGLRIGNSSVIQEVLSGIWNYTLIMNIYTDPAHLHPVEPQTEIQLNERLWMVISTDGLDSNLIAIVTEACWATSRPSAEANPRHYLIFAGCTNPDDDTVEMVGNGMGTSNSFSFNMFKFYAENTELYLHCLVHLCPAQSQSCVPDCSGHNRRKRRSIRSSHADGNPALVTMAWKK